MKGSEPSDDADDKYLRDLRRVAGELGKNCVSKKEYSEHGEWSPGTIRMRFGSWSEGVREAGLEVARGSERVTADAALSDLERVNDGLGRPAKKREYAEMGEHSLQLLRKRFGSFGEAQGELGHEVYRGVYPEEDGR